MTDIERHLIDLAEKATLDKYKGFVNSFSWRIGNIIRLGNMTEGRIVCHQITQILEIINPSLTDEIKWLEDVQNGFKLWVNEKRRTNVILGVTNHNQYNTRVFEEAIARYFELSKARQWRCAANN